MIIPLTCFGMFHDPGIFALATRVGFNATCPAASPDHRDAAGQQCTAMVIQLRHSVPTPKAMEEMTWPA